MEASDLILLATPVLLFGVVSRRLATTVVTPPMVFVVLGVVMGSEVLGLLDVMVDEEGVHLLAELTLVFVLFGDAARIDLRALRREVGLPVRLLAIGMPLTIGAGMLVAKLLFPSFGWLEAAVLAAVLAPTDAALGQAVVSSKSVPLRIRQALNVESGLNDGIALPVVMLLAALGSMGAAEGARDGLDWATYGALQVTLGPIAGIAAGWLGGQLVAWGDARGWMEESFERLAGLALALLSFGLAELVGGNGFIAAFVAGLTLGNSQRHRCHWIYDFLEAEGQLLMLLVFLFLGATLAWPAVVHADWRIIVYAALSLTVIRALPVAISMVGSRLRLPSVLFLGWFGPRGLATVLFAILIIDQADLPHGQEIFGVAIFTAVVSVFAHGLTAAPGAKAYGNAAASPDACPEEHEEVTEHQVRGPSPEPAACKPEEES